MDSINVHMALWLFRSYKVEISKIYRYSSFSKQLEYRKCYKILGISESSDQEEIRKAYLALVKKYHPDSGTEEADAEKFHEIDKAFKTLINKKSKERWGIEDEDRNIEEQDIKHTAPQHRQYLSFGGMGSGTPSQRQKQYGKFRAMQAASNVMQHRISKVAAEEGALLAKAPLKHKIKTKYGFDRLVEDLIQESMSKGEFNNLSGCGKPLKSHENRNPYVDFVTHKLNEVLIDNGFTPEWIMLHKEIREEIREFRNAISTERSYFGANPLSEEEAITWQSAVWKFRDDVVKINKKIDKFNLVVPIMEKQMIQIDLEKEAGKALANGRYGVRRVASTKNIDGSTAASSSKNVFDFIEDLFKK